MKTLPIRNSINRSPLRSGLLLTGMALSFGLLALSPAARAVDPPPDGGYPNFNTAEGEYALFSLTTGTYNTATGNAALFSNTTGFYNTANGASALNNNTTGNSNTATGISALALNTTGSDNTATGFSALFSNSTGSRNVATGASALYSNQTGGDNTATGYNTLYFNKGNYNTAHGYKALEKNTSGSNNTASGLNALNKNTTGSSNEANGAYALFSNTTGIDNTAIGLNALYSNTTGGNNIALGFHAGFNLTTGSLNIHIGNTGVAAEANTIRVGTVGSQTNAYIAGISGVTVAGGAGDIVDSNGHLGTAVSSARFKEAIQPMDKTSEAILSLRPVTFRYKHELDPSRIPQFGLVAEQVEKVNPDLIVRDEQGKPYTVRYEAVNVMLLNEFLKEHRVF